MVAGSIPGQTQTVPLAIYDAIQAGQEELAHRMVLAMTCLAFFSIAGVRWLQSKKPGVKKPRRRLRELPAGP